MYIGICMSYQVIDSHTYAHMYALFIEKLAFVYSICDCVYDSNFSI